MTAFMNARPLSGVPKISKLGMLDEALSSGKTRADFGKKSHLRPAVFDQGKTQSASPAARLGLGSTNLFSGFRRCPADAIPARSSVTAEVLGDPRPGQFNHKPLWSYHKENRQ